MPRGIKILLWILVSIVLLFAVVVVAGPLLLPRDLLRARIVEVLGERSGRSVAVQDLAIRFFPSTRLRLDGVSIGSAPTGPRQTIEIDALDLRVALRPLLRKQIHVSQVELLRPRVQIELANGNEREPDASPSAAKTGPGASRPAGDEGPGAESSRRAQSADRPGEADGSRTDDPANPPSPSAGGMVPLQVHIERLLIRNGELLFYKTPGEPILKITGFDERLTATAMPSGDWRLAGDGDIASVLAHLPAGTFGEGLAVHLEKSLHYSASDDRLTIESVTVSLGKLSVQAEGHVDGLDSGDLRLALQLQGGPADVGSILAYLPADLLPATQELQSSGTVQVQATIRGALGGEAVPDYEFSLLLTDGRVQHPDIAIPISGLTVDLTATPKRLELRRLEALLGKSPFRASADWVGLDAEPNDQRFDVTFSGDLHLDELGPWLAATKASSLETSGHLRAELTAAGCPAAVNHLELAGLLTWEGATLAMGSLPSPITGASGRIRVDGQKINVEQCAARIGESDVLLTGSLRNWSALLDEEDATALLSGDLKLQSRRLNCNEILPPPEDPGTKTVEGETPAGQPPLFLAALGKVSAKVALEIDEFSFDDLRAQQIRGLVRVDQGRLQIEGVDLLAFGGALHLQGEVDGRTPTSVPFNLKADVVKVQAGELYTYASGLNRFGRLGEYLSGVIDVEAQMSGDLADDLSLNLTTFTSEGSLRTYGASISEHPLQNSLAAYFDAPEIRYLRVSDWLQPFRVEDGKLHFEGLSLKAEGFEVTGSGWQALDGKLEMNLDLLLPKGISGQALKDVPAQLRPLLTSEKADRVLVPVKIGGTFKAPRVGVDTHTLSGRAQDLLRRRLSEEQGRITDQLGDRAGQLLKDLVGEEPDSAKAGASDGEKLKKDAQNLLKDLLKKK